MVVYLKYIQDNLYNNDDLDSIIIIIYLRPVNQRILYLYLLTDMIL